MANESKKFALFACCLMTMQALRLVISTAGFCVVRFHIDCSLFNIFISRLVNAVYVAQLFGNWLGDLFVFALTGWLKIIAVSLSNWVEFACFCCALRCICSGEVGKLTGFYWSMVVSYFWWKVGEAPAISISGAEVDWYFAGFTLSGVWAACLKGLVMRCVTDGTKTVHFNSDALGDVNVSVVGTRSVKTTVDYRAAKWLFIITIVLCCFMCFEWSVIAILISWVTGSEKKTSKSEKKNGSTTPSLEKFLGWFSGFVTGWILTVPGAMLGAGMGWVFALCFKCCLPAAAYVKLTKWCQLIFGIVGALCGFLSGLVGVGYSTMGKVDTDKEPSADEWMDGKAWDWTKFKWDGPDVKGTDGTVDGAKLATVGAPMIGLVGGLVSGAILGQFIGACKGSKKRGTAAGAFFGSFFGLWFGEIGNGGATWKITTGNVVKKNGAAKGKEPWVVICGYFIVVCGLGTVYSIYPGMAPCSITQFKYFNIIDICILALSSIGPLVIMGVDLTEQPWRFGGTILKGWDEGADDGTEDPTWGPIRMWGAIGTSVLMTVATLICEGIVLDIMQHPFSKTAKKVMTIPWRACTLTILMVSFQLTSTGIGFGCVSAGSGFNDGVYNALSTLVLWTMECCGVLGEGYLTELKKYEPGKWPTQGMGKWATYKWWNRKAFGNAWQIWCCIGTTDLRRDIMLCRQ